MSRVQLLSCARKALDKGHLNAFISLKPMQEMLEEAQSADRRVTDKNEKSGIDGHLIAIKDNICTTGLPTTCASEMLRGYVSPYEATVVQKLRNAGAIIMGKTNMDEFGMGSHSMHSVFGAVSQLGPVGSSALSAGGSSGGSAVAVAASMCYAALGTDTGGSVRLPASYCGIVGFKPSYGMLSRWGVVAYANSLDTVGIMAPSVGKTKLLFEVINGHDHNDPTSLSPETRERLQHRLGKNKLPRLLRIGIPQEYNIEELTPPVRAVWRSMILYLENRGHRIVPISLPHTKHALSAYYVLAPAEASSNLAKYDGVRYGHREEKDRSDNEDILFAPTRRSGFGEEVRRRLLLGAYALSSEAIDNYFIQAQKVRRLVQKDFDDVFLQPNWLMTDKDVPGSRAQRVHVIMSPTALSTAPLLSDVKNEGSPLGSYVNDVLTIPASLAGIPAISIPIRARGKDQEELPPVGIQITAQYGDEATMFMAAEIFEKKYISEYLRI